MAIRLETSKKRGIENEQDAGFEWFHLNWARRIVDRYPHACSRTGPSTAYNCHGMSFASRRTSVTKSNAVQMILEDDDYREVNLEDVLPGDFVLYYSEAGEPNHSGVVVEVGGNILVPIVCSKWGKAGEFIHGLRDCPPLYGPEYRFYRCER